jgi:hypothetical protein
VRIRTGDLEFELQPGVALLCRPLRERPVLNLEPGSSEEDEDEEESELSDSEEKEAEAEEEKEDPPLPGLTVSSDLRPERLPELSKLESRGQLLHWARRLTDPVVSRRALCQLDVDHSPLVRVQVAGHAGSSADLVRCLAGHKVLCHQKAEQALLQLQLVGQQEHLDHVRQTQAIKV